MSDEVTQADREAAADLMREEGTESIGVRLAVRDGAYDNHAAVKAFAAHRRATEAKAEALVEALRKAEAKFRHYEDLHRLKCTADGDEKADRNREMADLCAAALASWEDGK